MIAETLPALCDKPDQRLEDLADYAAGVEVPHVPWLIELNRASPPTDLRCPSAATRAMKRTTDLGGASLLLVAAAPVMLLVALLVKLTSPGPAIFQQVRVGLNLRRPGRDRRHSEDARALSGADRRGCDRRRDFAWGRHFVLYKFRTMRVDAEKDGARFAVKGDPRVTPIGRLLRKTRLDELPQLWNVLRGEMSLVGPRPERPEFIRKLSEQIPGYLDRLGLQPGLTGVAQIVNGYDNNIESFRRKVAFDLLYLRNCCFWNDVQVLLRTVRVVLSGSGAL
jgi:lipopolysaccharide/colanic/teichoic acid biosynthesis glycosyltransferase